MSLRATSFCPRCPGPLPACLDRSAGFPPALPALGLSPSQPSRSPAARTLSPKPGCDPVTSDRCVTPRNWQAPSVQPHPPLLPPCAPAILAPAIYTLALPLLPTLPFFPISSPPSPPSPPRPVFTLGHPLHPHSPVSKSLHRVPEFAGSVILGLLIVTAS